MKNLQYFFQPESIAIIGASQNFKSINGMLVKYLMKHGYQGAIYPVNPKYEEIAGLQCYPSLLEIPGQVDMALVAVSVKAIIPILEQCVTKNVKTVIIYSSGFAETGEEGKLIQDKIREMSLREDMAVCGPNCLGSVNLLTNTVVAFSPILEEELIKGSVGFISQSGAFGFVTFHQAQEENIGFSYLVTTGNEVDLSVADYIEYMVEDKNTNVILCYVEGIKDGEKFKAAAGKALKAGKPIVILKVGRSEAGQKAVSSHTAALAGSDTIYHAFFKQKGIIPVQHSDELIDMAKIFANNRRSAGNRVGILSTSGGAGIMAVDTFSDFGLVIPSLAVESKEKIKQIIPSFGSSENPVDVTAQIFNEPTYLKNCLEIMVNDQNVDCMLVSLSTVGGELAETIARGIIEVFAQCSKPIAVSWGASYKLAGKAFDMLSKAGVPLYKQPVRCARALSTLVTYGEINRQANETHYTQRASEVDRHLMDAVLNETQSHILMENEAKKLLAIVGLPVTRELLAQSENEAVFMAEKLGYPLVMKVMSPNIPHKTEAGVLKIGIKNEDELRSGYREVYANALKHVVNEDIKGVLLQEMAPPGVEAIIGMKNDPQFGPVVMFGLGGVFVEALKDVSFKVPPLTRVDVEEMLNEIAGRKILEGFRGQPSVDRETLIQAILRLADLAVTLKDKVEEIDINPIILYPKGAKIVDALIVKKM
jgi:acetyltransferase